MKSFLVCSGAFVILVGTGALISGGIGALIMFILWTVITTEYVTGYSFFTGRHR